MSELTSTNIWEWCWANCFTGANKKQKDKLQFYKIVSNVDSNLVLDIYIYFIDKLLWLVKLAKNKAVQMTALWLNWVSNCIFIEVI
jgi:hypothetical protein